MPEPAVPACPPPLTPPAELLKPNASLLIDPSIVTLLYLKFVPANELLFDCGVSLVKSFMLLPNVGIELICARLMFIPGVTFFPPATTTSCNEELFVFKLIFISGLLPSIKFRLSVFSVLNPTKEILIVYGPPGFRLGITKIPLLFV